MTATMQMKNPKFIKLRQNLLREIMQSNPGTRLPSVREMMRTYNVGQMIVDRCLCDFEAQGLLERRHRSGLFVSSRANEKYKKARVIGLFAKENSTKNYLCFRNGLQRVCDTDKSLIVNYNSVEVLGGDLENSREMSQLQLDCLVVFIDSSADELCLPQLAAITRRFGIRPVVVGSINPGFPADWITVSWDDIAWQIIQRINGYGGKLTLLTSMNDLSLALNLKKSLEANEKSCEVIKLEQFASRLSSQTEAIISVGLSLDEFHSAISWKMLEGLKVSLAITRHEETSKLSAHQLSGILPIEEMGSYSYKILVERMGDAHAWSPRTVTFSMIWEGRNNVAV